jgi:hypothetical protein
MVRKTAVLALIALAGCREPVGPSLGAKFDVLAHDYMQGQQLTARLTNGSLYLLGYNLCFTALERRDANGWTTANGTFGLPAGAACTTSLATLEPGASVDYHATVPSNLAMATYRLSTYIELSVRPSSRQLTLTTSPFVIDADRISVLTAAAPLEEGGGRTDLTP